MGSQACVGTTVGGFFTLYSNANGTCLCLIYICNFLSDIIFFHEIESNFFIFNKISKRNFKELKKYEKMSILLYKKDREHRAALFYCGFFWINNVLKKIKHLIFYIQKSNQNVELFFNLYKITKKWNLYKNGIRSFLQDFRQLVQNLKYKKNFILNQHL